MERRSNARDDASSFKVRLQRYYRFQLCFINFFRPVGMLFIVVLSLRFRVAKDGKALESIGIGTKANLTLGRKSELCDVVLEHHTISRRHAVIMHRGDGNGSACVFRKILNLIGVDASIMAHVLDAHDNLSDFERLCKPLTSCCTFGTGTLHISDLASAQGSTLNGQLLTPNNPAELHEGDILRFGQSSRIYTLSLEQQIPQQGSDALAAELPATFRGNDDGRRRREAEIAAMTASLVGAPRAPNTSAVEVESKAKAAIPALHEKSLATSSPTRKSTAASDEAENEDEEPLSLEERARSLGIPASHEAVMEGHSKAALCMAIDPAGGRVLR
jgi:pSer/pThr/pTyr-binding forkhead associated (FHA) protein